MPRLSVLFVSVAVFLAATAFSQTPSPAPESSMGEERGPFLLLLLAQAEGGVSVWRPDWPASFPPDAFDVSAKSVRSIELVMESAEKMDGDTGTASVSALARWDSKGNFLEFPAAQAGTFSQVSVRSSAGQPMGLSVANEASVVFKFSPDGLSSSAIVDGEAGRVFVSFLFRRWPLALADGNVVETHSGEDGGVTGVYDYTFLQGKVSKLESRLETGEIDTMIRFDYDSFGRIAAIAEPPFEAEALYDGSGRVIYWRFGGAGAGGNAESAADNTIGDFEERRFQWDERGLLVREIVSKADGRTEFRYEYLMDARGNWIERRCTRWVERFGSLVGEDGPRSIRRIRYR